MKIPHRKRKVTTVTLDPEIVEKARKHNLNISRLSEDALKETIKRLEHEAEPMGAPIKKGGEKEMVRKLPWATAAVIVLVAAIGAWVLWAPAAEVAPPTPSPTPEEVWTEFAYLAPPDNSGIENIYIVKSGQDYTENFQNLGTDNVWGAITSSGAEFATMQYGQDFAIVVAVTGHTDNIGKTTLAYLKVALQASTDSGDWSIPYENSDDNSAIDEYSRGTVGNAIFAHVVWDNDGSYYQLEADDNLNITAVDLYLRG